MGQSQVVDVGWRSAIRDFETLGICLRSKVIPEADLIPLRAAFGACVDRGPGKRVFSLFGSGGGVELLRVLGDIASHLSGRPARMVRILAFDKTPETNWGVPWHQDRTIAVKQRAEVEGFGPWSVKGGVSHVAPPQALLEAMFSMRLHLDDCGADNGPLKVIPGSHRLGRLSVREVLDLGAREEASTCLAGAGDVLAMKALTVHASDPASAPRHRRVLHVDFSTADLPPPLEWAID